jgi:hypothetical protein
LQSIKVQSFRWITGAKENLMSHTKKLPLILSLLTVLAATSMMVGIAGAAATAENAVHSERFTGALVNLYAGARSSRPFTLSVNHYSDPAELLKISHMLAKTGPYALRDRLFKEDAGTLSFGGGIGYPVAAVFAEDSPTGRTVRVLFNRPLRGFEVARITRSSKYPFGYLELHLDKNDNGDGKMIAAARLHPNGDTLDVVSLGSQPLRLVDIRAN